MITELKPCPFCGGEAKYHEDNGEYQNYVTCQNKECGMYTYGEWMHDPTTITRWNTRAVPVVTELERIECKVSKYGLLIEEFRPDVGEYVRYDQAAEVIQMYKDLSALQSETIELLEKDVMEERQRSAAARQLWADAQAKAKHWKANHDNMAQRNAVLSQRPDLPVDRLPAIKRYEERLAALTDRAEAAEVKLAEYEMLEPVAIRYDFDGYGFQYLDSGSGSDWQTRKLDGELLYALPAKEQRK